MNISLTYRISASFLALLLLAAGPIAQISHACMMTAMSDAQEQECGDSDHAAAVPEPSDSHGIGIDALVSSFDGSCCPELSTFLSPVSPTATVIDLRELVACETLRPSFDSTYNVDQAPGCMHPQQYWGASFPLYLANSSFLI